MRVFKLNECDWYMAETLEQAIASYMLETGLPRDEAADEPRELTAEEMQRLVFVDDDNHVNEVRRSFAEELGRRLATDPRPQLFASTEV